MPGFFGISDPQARGGGDQALDHAIVILFEHDQA